MHGTTSHALPATKTYFGVQALRAVAALLVVLAHLLGLWDEKIAMRPPSETWGNGAAGVDIFFVVSGFVMVISAQRLAIQVDGWKTFLRLRIVRIVPLYWLMTAVKIAAVLLLPTVVVTQVDATAVVRSLLFFPLVDGDHFRPIIPVGWTLTYEFLFYLMFAIALALRVDVMRVILPGLGAVAVLGIARQATWPDWTVIFSTIVIEFLFGVMLARLTLRGHLMRPVIATCLVLAGFALILVIPIGSEKLRPLSWGIPALMIVASAVSLESRLGNRLPGWLHKLGDASYSIYLSHGFLLPVVIRAFQQIGRPEFGPMIIAAAISLIACSIFGWLLYRFVERPLLQIFRREHSSNVLAEARL